MAIARDRPAYESAKRAALRCLQQRRRGEHAWTVAVIAYTYAGEWALDEAETGRLDVLLSKAS